MTTAAIKKNTKELEGFIKKANRKLLELEVMQSVSELKEGKGRVYDSSTDFMRYIKSKLN